MSAIARIPDPDKEEMLQTLRASGCQNEDGFADDCEVAIYWFAHDYHGGQWSNLYSALSTSPYTPGRCRCSIDGEGSLAEDLYAHLVSNFIQIDEVH